MGIIGKLILTSLYFLILVGYGLPTFILVLIISGLTLLVYKNEDKRYKKIMKD